METKDGKLAIYAETRQDWRNWLTQNSQKEKSVWLILGGTLELEKVIGQHMQQIEDLVVKIKKYSA